MGETFEPGRRWRLPARTVFEGRFVRLEPLDPLRHGPDLFVATAGHDRLWDYLSYGPFPSEAAFVAWAQESAAGADPMFFALVDRRTDKACGFCTLMRIVPAHGCIEIGNICHGPAIQRTPLTTEAMHLLFSHVMSDLGYRRLEWKCNALNMPSRNAALRLGFTFEGIFRQHMVTRQKNRDTAWFSIIDSEWPVLDRAMGNWLAPSNFDADGRQVRRLGDLIAAERGETRS